EALAVLERVDARAQRRVDAIPAVRVRGDLDAEAVRLVDDRGDLGGREVDAAADRAIWLAPVDAVVGVQLDPVGAVADLLAYRLARLLRPVDRLHADRHFELPVVAEQRIHAGRRERTRDDEHPRARHDAAIDRLLEIDIGVHRALGLEIA